MTSRLKHKLELDNVNLNSAYLNESFVMIGTPLPALAETRKDQLEYVPEWNQEVRDQQGRRRFHGAFTGGFSAGYYNSVGSKEGWAPQTFKSSRNNRSKKQQRAEDFMDEEDLAQMNEDRKLENTETFRSDAFAGTKEELGDKGLPSSLESLIAPARTSIGQSLPQKLGWRPGQGIGPRVTLRKLRRQEGQAVKRDGEDEEMDDVEAGKHTFAPRDAKLLVYQAKEDREGLGYEKGKGMGRLPGQRGPAFGVGHVEDDEDDPYGASTSGVGPYVFDNAADNNDEIIVMGGPSRPGLSSGAANGGRGKEGDERWHDGRPLLSGFQLDPLGVPPDKWFEMPEIPPDWRPRPARVWGTTRRLEEKPGVKVEEKEVIRGAPGKPLTFEQRGEALGEEQRISTAKSVFEYISEKDRDRLASIAAAAEQPAPPPPFSIEPEPEDLPRPPADEIVIPPLSPRTASAALKGFVPYGDDPARQDRYRSYLSSQTYNTQTPNPDLKPAASFDEINKELEGFASSARIFKPMSFAMSSRFTSGSTSLAATDLKQAKPGLHLYDAEKAKAEAAKPKIAEAEVQRDLTPRQQAAANGMFGTMTREVKEFHPVKLLCKRFGVADPHPEGEPAKIETGTANTGLENLPLPKNDASWESQFVHQPGTDQVNPSAPVPSDTSEERRPRTLAEVGMAEDVNQGRDTLTYTKPSIDIFKAIFASDDDDDDDEEVEVKPAVPAAVPVEGVSDPFPVPEKVVDEGPVDLATFKPVFAVHRERDDKGKEERRKEKKEKKKRKGVLSFDVSEDREDVDSAVAREEKKRKKRESDNGNGDAGGGGNESRNGHVRVGDREGDGEWVEKPAVKPRLAGRMGAADFM